MDLQYVLNPSEPQYTVATWSTTFKFLSLPPEIRNMIYIILLINEISIPIASPHRKQRREKRRDRTYFACLLRVNRQINEEAKTIFYGSNTFAIGNGRWGSKEHPNLHGLKKFTARVPKPCIRLIQHIELEVCCKWIGYRTYRLSHNGLKEVACSICKYFAGIQSVLIKTLDTDEGWYGHVPGYLLGKLVNLTIGCTGCERSLKALQSLFSMPTLKDVYIKLASCENIMELMYAVADGQDNRELNIKVVV